MNVHIVDDEPELLASLAILLRRAGHDVHCFSTAAAFLSVAADLPLGCVLLDLYLPDGNGLEIQRQLAERGASHPIVLLTGGGEIPDAVQAMRAGAIDFLRKPYRAADLFAALDHAQVAIDEELARRRQNERFAALDRLSPREREVLGALAGGGASKVVAYDLGISVRTVEMHRANILKKLEVNNIGAALLLAQASGTLSA